MDVHSLKSSQKIELFFICLEGGGGSLRLGDTDFESGPNCEIGKVLACVIAHTYTLREAVGSEVPVYTSKMDVRHAFPRIRKSSSKYLPVSTSYYFFLRGWRIRRRPLSDGFQVERISGVLRNGVEREHAPRARRC